MIKVCTAAAIFLSAFVSATSAEAQQHEKLLHLACTDGYEKRCKEPEIAKKIGVLEHLLGPHFKQSRKLFKKARIGRGTPYLSTRFISGARLAEFGADVKDLGENAVAQYHNSIAAISLDYETFVDALQPNGRFPRDQHQYNLETIAHEMAHAFGALSIGYLDGKADQSNPSYFSEGVPEYLGKAYGRKIFGQTEPAYPEHHEFDQTFNSFDKDLGYRRWMFYDWIASKNYIVVPNPEGIGWTRDLMRGGFGAGGDWNWFKKRMTKISNKHFWWMYPRFMADVADLRPGESFGSTYEEETQRVLETIGADVPALASFDPVKVKPFAGRSLFGHVENLAFPAKEEDRVTLFNIQIADADKLDAAYMTLGNKTLWEAPDRESYSFIGYWSENTYRLPNLALLNVERDERERGDAQDIRLSLNVQQIKPELVCMKPGTQTVLSFQGGVSMDDFPLRYRVSVSAGKLEEDGQYTAPNRAQTVYVSILADVGSAKKTPKGRKKIRIGSFKVGKCFSTITLAFGGRDDAQFVYDRLGDFTYSNLQDAEVWFKYPTIKFREDGQLIYFNTKKLGGMFGSGGMIGSMVMSHVPLPMSELGLGNGSSDLDGAAFQMPLFVSESLAWPEVLTGNRAKKAQKVPLVAAIYGTPQKSECPADTQGPCQSLTMETEKIKKAALLSRLLKLGRSDLAATNLPLKEIRITYDRLKRPVQLDMEDTTVLNLYYDRDRAKPIPPGGMSVLP